MIRTFRSQALRILFQTGSLPAPTPTTHPKRRRPTVSTIEGIQPSFKASLETKLVYLNAARDLLELENFPGMKPEPRRFNNPHLFKIKVGLDDKGRAWELTFRWDKADIYDVDFQQQV